MANLARQQMYFGRFFGVDEMMEEIEAVTTAEVQELAQELFQPETMALTLLGNLGSMKIERGDLVC
jgi:predicted Zn-dependent peptidase